MLKVISLLSLSVFGLGMLSTDADASGRGSYRDSYRSGSSSAESSDDEDAAPASHRSRRAAAPAPTRSASGSRSHSRSRASDSESSEHSRGGSTSRSRSSSRERHQGPSTAATVVDAGTKLGGAAAKLGMTLHSQSRADRKEARTEARTDRRDELNWQRQQAAATEARQAEERRRQEALDAQDPVKLAQKAAAARKAKADMARANCQAVVDSDEFNPGLFGTKSGAETLSTLMEDNDCKGAATSVVDAAVRDAFVGKKTGGKLYQDITGADLAIDAYRDKFPTDALTLFNGVWYNAAALAKKNNTPVTTTSPGASVRAPGGCVGYDRGGNCIPG